MRTALNQGAARRRTAGETAGPPVAVAPEKLLTVSIPKTLHAELKGACAQADMTMKQLVIRGIEREIAAIRKRTDN